MPGQLGSTRIPARPKAGVAVAPSQARPKRSSLVLPEVLLWIDSGVGTLTLFGTSSDAETHTASRAGSLTLTGSGVESYSFVYTDSGSGTISFSGTQTQSQTHTASRSGTVTFGTGAISEFFTGFGNSETPAPSIEFTLSGTGAQAQTHAASATGTLTLTGSASQSMTHTASRAGSLTLTGSGVESFTTTYADAGMGTITLGYVRGTAYPGDFFPGQVYPGQTAVSTPSRDSQTRSGTGAFTLTGSGADSYSFGATTTHDAMSGTITLSGSIAMESLGALDSTSGREGAFTLSGTATSHQSWELVEPAVVPGSLTLVASAAAGSLGLSGVDSGVLTLVPVAAGTVPITPAVEDELLLNPV
jgi:hypothetical protein